MVGLLLKGRSITQAPAIVSPIKLTYSFHCQMLSDMSIEFLKRNLQNQGFNIELRLYHNSNTYAQQKRKIGAARDHGLNVAWNAAMRRLLR